MGGVVDSGKAFNRRDGILLAVQEIVWSLVL
jgi:hypothetical protein